MRANGVSLAPLLGILFFKLRERPQEDAILGADNEALRRSEERYRAAVESAKDYAPSAPIPRAASLTGPHRRLVRSAAAVFRQHPIAPRQKPLLEKPVDMTALGMALEKASSRRRIWQDQG